MKMHNSDVFLLTAIAYTVAEQLTDDELAKLSADLVTIGDILASIAIRRTAVQTKPPGR